MASVLCQHFHNINSNVVPENDVDSHVNLHTRGECTDCVNEMVIFCILN